MAVTCTLSRKFKETLTTAGIDFSTHTFKIILIDTTANFTFNPQTHSYYSDVSASELANGNGYSRGTLTIGPFTTSFNAQHNYLITYPLVAWLASGGNIGPASGAVIYDESSTNDVIVGYINFGENKTAYDGGQFSIAQGTITLT